MGEGFSLFASSDEIIQLVKCKMSPSYMYVSVNAVTALPLVISQECLKFGGGALTMSMNKLYNRLYNRLY